MWTNIRQSWWKLGMSVLLSTLILCFSHPKTVSKTASTCFSVYREITLETWNLIGKTPDSYSVFEMLYSLSSFATEQLALRNVLYEYKWLVAHSRVWLLSTSPVQVQQSCNPLGSGLGYLEHICQLIEKIGQLQETNLRLQRQICSLQKDGRMTKTKEVCVCVTLQCLCFLCNISLVSSTTSWKCNDWRTALNHHWETDWK